MSSDGETARDRLPKDHPDLIAIGQTMTRMRLLIGRRFIGRMAIKRVNPGIDLSDIDAIGVLKRMAQHKEVTIGVIAEHMRIDPSRGSRIVADLVRQGYLERGVSQEDGRRSIVKLTRLGEQLMSELEEVKRETVADVTRGWSTEEVATFARLYDRFTSGLEQLTAQLDATEGSSDQG
ncbi:MarR family transcriptional regulator [Peteryoungia desertarenae]|uniref:MarR family transcriptional regulator n=1 Tax=Peteryoungia desertarenae TaxID=1813451 RepID=A0ABX6QMJ6_9HYPH|nr:MarR family transcriptional regulator [Peteryoungia desertarenae]QLF69753.1 MarR family transcriptional regulator [Peteryoungia desertarenae]